MTVRELLDQLDLHGESTEKVYVWDYERKMAYNLNSLEHYKGKLTIFGHQE